MSGVLFLSCAPPHHTVFLMDTKKTTKGRAMYVITETFDLHFALFSFEESATVSLYAREASNGVESHTTLTYVQHIPPFVYLPSPQLNCLVVICKKKKKVSHHLILRARRAL